MLGVETGTFAYAVAAAAGLTGLIAASELGFTVVKYAGAAYLVHLGVRKLLEPADMASAAAPARRSRLFLDGLLVQLLNPKIAVFFLAFLPQFVDPGRGHVVVQTLLLGTVFTLLAVLSDGACALLAGTLGGVAAQPGPASPAQPGQRRHLPRARGDRGPHRPARQGVSPARIARIAACTRSRLAVLLSTLLTWVFTELIERCSRADDLGVVEPGADQREDLALPLGERVRRQVGARRRAARSHALEHRGRHLGREDRLASAPPCGPH